MTNAMILASKHVMLIRWVVLASRKHAPAAMTLVNLKKMEKHVFCFGAGKYNNVAMVIIIDNNRYTNRDNLYRQKE